MKKIILILLFISTLNIAQNNSIAGSWILTKVVVNGEVHTPYQLFDFTKDGKMKAMEMEIASYTFNPSSNQFTMKSDFDKDFNGSAIVEVLDKNRLVMKNENVVYTYLRIEKNEIEKNNKASQLIGKWQIKSDEGATKIIVFNEPDNFKVVESNSYSTTNYGGTWIYNPEDNSLITICFSDCIKGKNYFESLTKEKFILVVGDEKIVANKIDADNKFERLTFEYEDFDEDKDFTDQLPWLDFSQMVEYLKNVTEIKFRVGNLLPDVNVFSYYTTISKIKVDTIEQSVNFVNLAIEGKDTSQYSENHKGGLMEQYNSFFPRNELLPFKITGVDSLSTPAGTFNCTVIEGFDGEDRVKLWMINDKPGIYAKIILDKYSPFDKVDYQVHELEEIK